MIVWLAPANGAPERRLGGAGHVVRRERRAGVAAQRERELHVDLRHDVGAQGGRPQQAAGDVAPRIGRADVRTPEGRELGQGVVDLAGIERRARVVESALQRQAGPRSRGDVEGHRVGRSLAPELIGKRDEVVDQPRVRLRCDVVQPRQLTAAAIGQSRVGRHVQREGGVVERADVPVVGRGEVDSQRR